MFALQQHESSLNFNHQLSRNFWCPLHHHAMGFLWDFFFLSASFTSILHPLQRFVLSWPPFVLFAVIHRYRWPSLTPLRKLLLLRNFFYWTTIRVALLSSFFSRKVQNTTLSLPPPYFEPIPIFPVYYRLIKIVFVRLPLSLIQSTYFLFIYFFLLTQADSFRVYIFIYLFVPANLFTLWANYDRLPLALSFYNSLSIPRFVYRYKCNRIVFYDRRSNSIADSC